MLEGLAASVSPDYLLYIAIGTLAGIFMGAMPGLTATMGTALLLPFTFGLEPGQALAMLGALYVASMYADSVPACLVNTPGTPSAMATALDGFQLTKQGKGQHALVASAFSAMIGTFIGGLTFLFIAGPLADIALRFGPAQFFWVGIFALTIIGSLAGDSLLKGFAGGLIGVLIGAIGVSATGAVARYTFGFPQLQGGIDLVAALIGIFAMPQVLAMVGNRREESYVAQYERRRGVTLEVIRSIVRRPGVLLGSGAVGTFVGILPGAGSPVASLMAYNEAVRWSKDKKKFGKGAIEGVVASETAGNAAAGGSMVPMVALGVPGSAPAAVILGALLLQGLQPGPSLFASESGAVLVYTFAFSIIVAGIVTYLFGSTSAPLLARMVTVPVKYLAPVIFFLSVIGSFAIRNYIVDVYLMVIIGIAAFFLAKLGFHPGPIGLGLILGPIVEPALVQAMALSQASSIPRVFFTGTVNIVLIALTLFSIGWAVWMQRKDKLAKFTEGLEVTTEGQERERVAHEVHAQSSD